MMRPLQINDDMLVGLEQRRDKLKSELTDIALQMAESGRKLYELKNELNIVCIQISKINQKV